MSIPILASALSAEVQFSDLLFLTLGRGATESDSEGGGASLQRQTRVPAQLARLPPHRPVPR